MPGVDHAGLHAALEPHGRVEDMEVHGQLVGVRFYPDDASVRSLVPSGIELTPPRIERSTGPGHHDFEIVADETASVEDDMRRRDFTVNAIARRLETGELVDPFGGVADLERRVLRTVAEESFREDPLRILRGLRLVSQLDFTLAPETVAQMRAEAEGLRHVSGERIGGGVEIDGMGELSKLLLGTRPAIALRLARDTGALLEVIPELGPAIGYSVASPRQPNTLDEHLFAVAQAAADADAELHVRLAGLFHDIAKPETDGTAESHATVGAAMTARILRRLRYPNALRDEVVRLVAGHDFHLDRDVDAAAARRFLAAHGLEQARRLVQLKRADLSVKRIGPEELDALRGSRPRDREPAGQPVPPRRPCGQRQRPPGARLPGGTGARRGARAAARRRAGRSRRERARDAPRARERARAMKAAALRERYLRLREEAGAGVTVVVATKYVPLEELGVLAEAGVEVVGENRAQDLQAKHERYGDAFRWHFIGHLQSNKVKVVNGICELVHSLDSESVAKRLTVPALLEVNLSGEPSKAGVAPEEIDEWLARVPSIRGLMTMPPLAGEPEASRPWFSACATSRSATGWRSSRWGRRRTGASPSRRAPR